MPKAYKLRQGDFTQRLNNHKQTNSLLTNMPRFRRDNRDWHQLALTRSNYLGLLDRYGVDESGGLNPYVPGQLGADYSYLPMMQNFQSSHNDLLMGQRIRGDQWNDLQGGLLRNWMGYSPYGGFL